jgi:transposase-like protein/IS1 family transposase
LTNNNRLLYYLTMMNESQSVDGMTCEACFVTCQRFGRHRNGLRRFRCPLCKRTFTEPHTRTLDTMYISQERAVLALQLLLEGNSIRSTERICGMDRNTIMSLVVKAGDRCKTLMISKIVNLPVQDVQADEIWGFVQKKEGHKLPSEKGDPTGDAYCFIGIERHSKLTLAWHLGRRDQRSTDAFIGKLRYATSDSRYQLSTDGFKPYISAAKMYLKGIVDFAQLIKIYSTPREGEQRYSPGDVVEAVPVEIMGRPVRSRICTSHIERQNLSIRMGMRRMTRLTNGFSKKWENLEAAYSLWFAYYNWCRVHSSLRVTPCIEAGIESHIWTIEELIA